MRDAIGLGGKKIEALLKEYVGIPYHRGGSSPRGADCSGFARLVYQKVFGLDLPHSSADQYRLPQLQKIDESKLRTGDLLFFARKKRINHVGIYLSNGRFIHASSSQGIIVSELKEKYWKKRFVGSKRHVELTDHGVSVRLSPPALTPQISSRKVASRVERQGLQKNG